MNAATWLEGIPAPDKWRALVLTHGPRIATWALALALGVQAAFILTDLAGSGKTPSASGPLPAPFQSHNVNVATITGAALFGKNVAPAPNERNPVQSNIPLVLTGIMSANDPRDGLAILGPSATVQKVYAVGDNVPGGAKVHSVLLDRVVLDRNGTLEYLALPKNSQGGGIPITAPPTTNALQTENPVVERMRRMMTDDPGLMADIMRPQPVFAQGKQRGYRVYPGRNRAAFTRLGLHPGDLVTAINGTPLDDPSRGQEIFRTIGSSTEAHVTVMRNGQQQDLTLNMAQVAQEAESMTSGQGAPPAEPLQPGAPAEPAPTAPAPDNSQQ
jgi:general secretion pathway protein C